MLRPRVKCMQAIVSSDAPFLAVKGRHVSASGMPFLSSAPRKGPLQVSTPSIFAYVLFHASCSAQVCHVHTGTYIQPALRTLSVPVLYVHRSKHDIASWITVLHHGIFLLYTHATRTVHIPYTSRTPQLYSVLYRTVQMPVRYTTVLSRTVTLSLSASRFSSSPTHHSHRPTTLVNISAFARKFYSIVPAHSTRRARFTSSATTQPHSRPAFHHAGFYLTAPIPLSLLLSASAPSCNRLTSSASSTSSPSCTPYPYPTCFASVRSIRHPHG